MNITNKEAKILLIESIMLKNEVSKEGEYIKRHEFPREHIANVKSILKKVNESNYFLCEKDGEKFEIEAKGYKKEEHGKIISEIYSEKQIPLTESEVKTAKFFLLNKNEWRLISDDGMAEINAIIGNGKQKESV